MNSDLISREALKNELNRLRWTEENGFKYRFILDDIIDNTPTVPQTQITVFTENGNKEELEQELQRVFDELRPKGEWEFEYENYGEYYFTCNACNTEEEVPTVMGKPKYKFCPNCGAKMKGEEE